MEKRLADLSRGPPGLRDRHHHPVTEFRFIIFVDRRLNIETALCDRADESTHTDQKLDEALTWVGWW